MLAQLDYDFDIVLPDIEEAKQDHEQAKDYVLRLSLEKAQAGLAMAKPDSVVLGSDTVVVCDNHVLEKPKVSKIQNACSVIYPAVSTK